MRNKIGIVLVITGVILIAVFTACDGLIAPIEGRNNIYDESNPIKMPTGFSATVRDSQPNRVIELQWTPPETSAAEGYVIIRKTGSAPLNIWDGSISNSLTVTDSYIEDYENAEGEYPVGYRVYYSLFAYGPKWDDMSEEDRIQIPSDGSSNINNADNYNFVGPISDSVIITDMIMSTIARAGTMSTDWAAVQSWMGDNPLFAGYSDYSFITFDFSEISTAEIVKANLMLTTSAYNDTSAYYDEDLYIDLMSLEWFGSSGDTATGTSGTDTDTAIDKGYQILTNVSQIIDDTTYIEITPFVKAWINGDRENYGLRLHNDFMGTMDEEIYTFYGVGNGDSTPMIEVEYYYD